MENGSAIVKKDSVYGLISKNGTFLIQPQYQELSEANDDIYMAVRNDNSGYLHKNGDTLTGFIFDLAGDFINGFAIINKTAVNVAPIINFSLVGELFF